MTPPLTRELEPCPFCGSADLDHSDERMIECKSCMAMGPCETTAKVAIKAWNTRVQSGSVSVKREPSIGLLMSMALRLDHAIGCKGYYDQFGQNHALRLELAISDMRKVYEEISGQGFYKPEREDEYAAMASLAGKGEGS